MKIYYHDYSDQNYHGYQYYHGIVKMCWTFLKSTNSFTKFRI